LERIRADGEAIRESIANLKAAGSSGELVEINATLTQVQAAETALTTAQATLSTAQSKRAQGAPDAALVRARADASAARQALDALPAESALAQAVTDAGAALDAATTAHASAQARYEAGDSRLRQHAQVLAAIDGEIVALRALAHDAAGTCRHCQGEDPLGLSGRLDEAQARRDAAASEVETWTSIASTRKAAVTSAAATVGSARTQQQAAERALSDARRRRDAAESAVRTADATVTREEGLLRTADALLDAAEASAKSAVTTAEERLAAARATLADLEGRLTSATGAPVTGDLDTLHAQRDALVVDYKRVQAEIELFVRQQERTNAHQAAIARREQALVDFDSVKALKAALNALKSAVAASAYAPIEEAANAFLVDAGIGLRVKFRDEGDFGANVASLGGSYVSFWSLSDAERAEFGAALAVAFAKLTRSPWPAVILDGIEKIDRKHRSGLLRAAGALVHRGELANFLAAYVSDEPPAEMADGVTVHWLGASDAVAVAS
jgi:chromosome segregation ATPase